MSPEFYLNAPIPPHVLHDVPSDAPFQFDTLQFSTDDIREMLRDVLG